MSAKSTLNQYEASRPGMSRREFLKVSATAGGGLLIGIYLAGCQKAPTATPEPTVVPATATPSPTTTPAPTPTPSEPTAWLEPNIFLKIDNTGSVTIMSHKSEMGQGVRTAQAMIVAEELEADWSKVHVEQAPVGAIYGDSITGGSNSMRSLYMPLRKAGAAVRTLLIAAAAQMWGVEEESCYAENGEVIHQPTGRRLSYGALVETAATLPPPSTLSAELKDPKDFRLISTRIGRLEDPQIVDGSATYGMDVKLPGMLYATVARCPVFDGKVASFDASQAKAVEGVRHVVEIEDGIAVVAESTWAALQGRQALEITWDEGRKAGLSSEGIRQELAGQLGTPAGNEVVYEMPFLAHVTPEPMNCVADVRQDSCELWAPTQDVATTVSRAMSITGLPREAVQVHVPLIGGGFGRRFGMSFVEQAVEISQAVGAPVKVVWTREDDMQHDLYHPYSYHHARPPQQEKGLPRVRSAEVTSDVPTGYWRSVGNIPEAFARECFLDEMAVASGKDPYELRLELTSYNLTYTKVLELAAAKAGWGDPLPERWGRGIACHSTWHLTPVAQVVEVSVDKDGVVRVHRVVCAVDCGLVVNPSIVEAQMEGGIVMGLTAALKGEITIENGRVQQSNFHDYPILRIDEMPTIEVYIVPSEANPSGVGEMAVPPVIPALLNAVFAATGKRIRRLPIRSEDLRET